MDRCWICALKPYELDAWQQGDLDTDAKRLGIRAWSIPTAVDRSGTFNIDPKKATQSKLPSVLSLELQHPLKPSDEYKIITQLRHWIQVNEPLKLWGRPLLILKGSNHLSNPLFSLKRLHLAAKNLMIFSRDAGDIVKLQQLGIDGKIQENWSETISQPSHYLLNLKRAHHNMEARGCWIPSVQGITKSEEQRLKAKSPHAYKEWLCQATAWSKIRFFNSNTSPVLIDSWEGHRRWWTCANKSSEAKKHPLLSNFNTEVVKWGKRKADHLALMIHGFYLDKLEEILDQAIVSGQKEGVPKLDLYISTPIEQLYAVKALVKKKQFSSVYIVGVPNRGRDIAPFLIHLVPPALKIGHRYFVKLHTKRSPQLVPGDQWGQYLTSSLLNPDFLKTLDQVFSDPLVSLIAPKGSVIPSSVELRQNVEHILSLLAKYKINGQWVLQKNFIAGSMMAGKGETLKRMSSISLSINEFEPEEGQTDGTLAHALERLISWVAIQGNLVIKEIGYKLESSQNYGYKWIEDPDYV